MIKEQSRSTSNTIILWSTLLIYHPLLIDIIYVIDVVMCGNGCLGEKRKKSDPFHALGDKVLWILLVFCVIEFQKKPGIQIYRNVKNTLLVNLFP